LYIYHAGLLANSNSLYIYHAGLLANSNSLYIYHAGLLANFLITSQKKVLKSEVYEIYADSWYSTGQTRTVLAKHVQYWPNTYSTGQTRTVDRSCESKCEAITVRVRNQQPSDMASHSREMESSGRCCVPEDCIMSVHCCEDLKSYVVFNIS